MKKVWFLFAVLLLASSVLAMTEPITVKSQPGDEIRISVWPSPSGPLLNLDYGTADEDGIFQTTFYSLNTANVKYRIVINRDDENIQDESFEDLGISSALNFDCTKACKYTTENLASSEEVVEEILEEEVSGEVVMIEAEDIVEETSSTEVPVSLEEGISNVYSQSRTLRIEYIIAGIAGFILITAAVFFAVFHKKKPKKEKSGKDDDLDRIERKVKETEEKIARIKAEKEKHKKLREAREVLKKEESELQELEEASLSEN